MTFKLWRLDKFALTQSMWDRSGLLWTLYIKAAFRHIPTLYVFHSRVQRNRHTLRMKGILSVLPSAIIDKQAVVLSYPCVCACIRVHVFVQVRVCVLVCERAFSWQTELTWLRVFHGALVLARTTPMTITPTTVTITAQTRRQLVGILVCGEVVAVIAKWV